MVVEDKECAAQLPARLIRNQKRRFAVLKPKNHFFRLSRQDTHPNG
jgi:hypothetical protein